MHVHCPVRDGVHDEAPLRAELRRVDAVIVRLFAVDAGVLAAAQCLKVVAKHGAGLDNIDCQAATERGIPVIYTPGANANAVAEHAIGLLLALARNTCVADTTLRDGRAYERGHSRASSWPARRSPSSASAASAAVWRARRMGSTCK